ncbi:hypothetical protein [Leptolyngbya ohadii]|uniref:hypothetical protein n=1 Tax=Leptolyngbya ohadii TaxID=1962290 RepID=UPI000B59A9A2|nr:hypothetical protein [Leptolyngbya ohadii]
MRSSSAPRLVSIACLTALLISTHSPLSLASLPVSPSPHFLIASSTRPLTPSPPSLTSPSLIAQSPHSSLPRSVNIRVRRTIARETQIPASRLRIVAATQETWRDGCLGLGRPAEGCLAALVPGWRVTVNHGSQTWIYRSDGTGRSLRQESQTGSSALSQEVGDRVLAMAARESGIAVERLRITQAEEKTWDGCLGIETGVAMCPQIAIFGWRLVVTGNGKSWVYHSNGDGSEVRLNRFATTTLEGLRFFSDLTAPLEDQVLFRSTASGGIAGYTYETVLMKSGQVMRSLLQADEATFPPRLHRVSKAQVEAFEKLLQHFRLFDRLSYTTPQPVPDAIMVTLTSPVGTTQYSDAVADQLPPDLQAIVEAWGAIADNR